LPHPPPGWGIACNPAGTELKGDQAMNNMPSMKELELETYNFMYHYAYDMKRALETSPLLKENDKEKYDIILGKLKRFMLHI
jgi:hypothetical protein